MAKVAEGEVQKSGNIRRDGGRRNARKGGEREEDARTRSCGGGGEGRAGRALSLLKVVPGRWDGTQGSGRWEGG